VNAAHVRVVVVIANCEIRHAAIENFIVGQLLVLHVHFDSCLLTWTSFFGGGGEGRKMEWKIAPSSIIVRRRSSSSKILRFKKAGLLSIVLHNQPPLLKIKTKRDVTAGKEKRF